VVGKTKRGKGSKIVAIADRTGLPVSVHVLSASPHEVTLAESTLAARFFADEPERLILGRCFRRAKLEAATKPVVDSLWIIQRTANGIEDAWLLLKRAKVA
jgi:hypothetical protein